MTHDAESPVESLRRHRECWERIPWLANETLDPREYARIESHLRACGECQQELAVQQSMRAAMRADDRIVLAPQTALHKLMQRMDADESAPPAPQASIEVSTHKRVKSSARAARWPRWVAIAAAVQGVALALLLITQQRTGVDTFTAPRFETLTAEEPRIQGAGPVIRVVFEAGVAVSDVNAILRAIDAQIIAGPTEAGVYTLALDAGDGRPGAHIDATLARLRADERVLFAESAVARGTP